MAPPTEWRSKTGSPDSARTNNAARTNTLHSQPCAESHLAAGHRRPAARRTLRTWFLDFQGW